MWWQAGDDVEDMPALHWSRSPGDHSLWSEPPDELPNHTLQCVAETLGHWRGDTLPPVLAQDSEDDIHG